MNQRSQSVDAQALYGFCASAEYSEEILARFAKENNEAGLAPYDACVEIRDHTKFREVVSAAAKNQGLELMAWGSCVYARRMFRYDERLPANPGMLKKEEHSWQCEVRLVYASNSSDAPEKYIDLDVPLAKKLLAKPT